MQLANGLRYDVYVLVLFLQAIVFILGFWDVALISIFLHFLITDLFFSKTPPRNTHAKGVIVNDPPFLLQQEKNEAIVKASDRSIIIMTFLSVLFLCLIITTKFLII